MKTEKLIKELAAFKESYENLINVVENHEKRLKIQMDIIDKLHKLLNMDHELISNLNKRVELLEHELIMKEE